MTGGMGRKNLTAFYRDHFIFSCVSNAPRHRHPLPPLNFSYRNPADIALETISRTVGADRIIGPSMPDI